MLMYQHKVDKGPVDTVTGKAKYTMNDNNLLREDMEYHCLTSNVLLAEGPGTGEAQDIAVCPMPLAVKYFFDLLDEQAQQHGISDQDNIHIWMTNSLPLRFWINIIKNPQLVFDVQTSDNMDSVLLVIEQTFMDTCTLADHKLTRVSPINKLLYAQDIPGYK
ncbi:Plexin-B1 [Cricetulus griseus]|uniref:Plexin-B1 n=1 Tax=Cricetulus griseus TaxID=10029 RepID=G3IIE0_CRIGR|nr:Plexin-B1 [Cricetulus griseus]